MAYESQSKFPIIMENPKMKKNKSQDKISQMKHLINSFLFGWLQRIKQKQKNQQPNCFQCHTLHGNELNRLKYSSLYVGQHPKRSKAKTTSDHQIKSTASIEHLTSESRVYLMADSSAVPCSGIKKKLRKTDY